jgi:hypothetical protein
LRPIRANVPRETKNSINAIKKLIMSKETLAKSIREIPDFPIPGILFYDVTTLFKNPVALQELSDTLYEMYKDKGITKVVGIESRGFIMGPILATRLGAGFVPRFAAAAAASQPACPAPITITSYLNSIRSISF